jgi:hypothetical protein
MKHGVSSYFVVLQIVEEQPEQAVCLLESAHNVANVRQLRRWTTRNESGETTQRPIDTNSCKAASLNNDFNASFAPAYYFDKLKKNGTKKKKKKKKKRC